MLIFITLEEHYISVPVLEVSKGAYEKYAEFLQLSSQNFNLQMMIESKIWTKEM